jgi:hypothetical protein
VQWDEEDYARENVKLVLLFMKEIPTKWKSWILTHWLPQSHINILSKVIKEAKQVEKANECAMITQVRVTKHMVIATLKKQQFLIKLFSYMTFFTMPKE